MRENFYYKNFINLIDDSILLAQIDDDDALNYYLIKAYNIKAINTIIIEYRFPDEECLAQTIRILV